MRINAQGTPVMEQGMRFSEIGQQLRAYRMESGLRAEEIAARLGFSSATNFSKYFHLRAGVTPLAFRAGIRRGDSPPSRRSV